MELEHGLREEIGIDVNRLGFSVGIEIDLVIVCWAKMTCLQRKDRLACLSGRNRSSFCVRAENDLVLCGHRH